MWRSKRMTAGVFAGAAVLGAAVAIAAEDSGPVTEQVEAHIVFVHSSIDDRECEGQDGRYFEERALVTGTSEGDPRLTGDVVLAVRVLNEIGTFEGYEQGRLFIRDPQSGGTKLEARFDNADTAEITQGVLVGELRDVSANAEDGDDVNGLDFFANWRVTFNDDGSITAQIGGEAADGRMPAVAVSGRCTGPFQHFEVDLPTPAGGAGAAAAPEQGTRPRWGLAR